jgi:tyrosyl-tRNA synthetase
MTEERVRGNVEAQRPIFERVFVNAAKGEGREARVPPILNNVDWLGKLGFLEALRDVGKHFSVNMMIQKDSVRERLNARDQGISYTEFSYMILQSYDYLVLFRDFAKYGLKGPVTLQMGGSDQWGNIVGGADLIRRIAFDPLMDLHITERLVSAVKEVEGDVRGSASSKERSDRAIEGAQIAHRHGAFGLTAPLVTKSDGTKFGKTESGAIWLTSERTSPYAYYQFWLNAADADVERYLKVFTLLSETEIGKRDHPSFEQSIMGRHAKEPGLRVAQRELARAATGLLHGEEAVAQAEAAAKALFSGEIGGLSESVLNEVFASAPSSEHEKTMLAGEGVALAEFLTQTTLAKSKREAREFLSSGSVMVNTRKAGAEDRLTSADLLHGKVIALRRGKKSWHVTRWK